MFVDKQSVGIEGEDLAADQLCKRKWTILHRNWATKMGEIDIIARDPRDVLVFVEVKTLGAKGALLPEDHLTHRKLTKMRQLAHIFANANPHLIHESGWRVDAIAIILSQRGEYSLRHYKNL